MRCPQQYCCGFSELFATKTAAFVPCDHRGPERRLPRRRVVAILSGDRGSVELTIHRDAILAISVCSGVFMAGSGSALLYEGYKVVVDRI